MIVIHSSILYLWAMPMTRAPGLSGAVYGATKCMGCRRRSRACRAFDKESVLLGFEPCAHASLHHARTPLP